MLNVEGLMKTEDGREHLISLAEDLIVKEGLTDFINADNISYMTNRGVHFKFKEENEIMLRWQSDELDRNGN